MGLKVQHLGQIFHDLAQVDAVFFIDSVMVL
jgi:hypothetical protein